MTERRDLADFVKILLADEGLYTVTPDDKEELENVELFFTFDILARDEKELLFWHAALARLQDLRLGRYLYKLPRTQFAAEDKEVGD